MTNASNNSITGFGFTQAEDPTESEHIMLTFSGTDKSCYLMQYVGGGKLAPFVDSETDQPYDRICGTIENVGIARNVTSYNVDKLNISLRINERQTAR